MLFQVLSESIIGIMYAYVMGGKESERFQRSEIRERFEESRDGWERSCVSHQINWPGWFKTREDPDDLISALLNEFSFEDNPETLDEVLDKIETPSLNEQEVSFLMDEELELSQCLDRCDELLRKLESRVKRIGTTLVNLIRPSKLLLGLCIPPSKGQTPLSKFSLYSI